MPRLCRIVAALIATALVVQAMAFAYFVTGLDRWMITEGRVGVRDGSAMLSTDDAFDGSTGVLDKGLLQSADRWLDTGIGLGIARVADLLVAPALAVLLLGLALATRIPATGAVAGELAGVGTAEGPAERVRMDRAWAGGLLILVLVQAMAALASVAVAAFMSFVTVAVALIVAAEPGRPVVAGLAGGSIRDRADQGPTHRGVASRRSGYPDLVCRGLAVTVAVGLVVSMVALGYLLDGVAGYLADARSQFWLALLSSSDWVAGSGGLSVYRVIDRFGLPAIAFALLIVALVIRTRIAIVRAATVLVGVVLVALLDLVVVARPVVAAGYALVVFATFAVAVIAGRPRSIPLVGAADKRSRSRCRQAGATSAETLLHRSRGGRTAHGFDTDVVPRDQRRQTPRDQGARSICRTGKGS